MSSGNFLDIPQAPEGDTGNGPRRRRSSSVAGTLRRVASHLSIKSTHSSRGPSREVSPEKEDEVWVEVKENSNDFKPLHGAIRSM